MAIANTTSNISQAHPDITVVVTVGALFIAHITNIISYCDDEALNLTTSARYASFASLSMAHAPSPIIRASAEMGCWQKAQREGAKKKALATCFFLVFRAQNDNSTNILKEICIEIVSICKCQ